MSQYVAADTYTQLTIDGKPYRVTPLEYADPIKWFNNQAKGIGEYIKVDMVTGNADLVDLKTPIKYSDSEYFNRDVKRHLRLKYPTKIFKTPSFEVDDEGNPFYVATVYQKQFGLAVPRPVSVIILDATNGETKEYSLADVRNGWTGFIQLRKPLSKSTTRQVQGRFLECHDSKKKRDPDYKGL